MFNRRILPASILIMVAGVISLYLYASTVHAASAMQIQTSAPGVQPTGEFSPISKSNISKGQQVPILVSDAKSLTREESFFQQIVAYKETVDAYAMQPGWTLIKYDQYDILPTSGPKPLPVKHQRETWSHFDENQQIFEEVEYAIAPEIGRVLLGYFAKGEGYSIWNDVKYEQQPYKPSYDLYLVSTIRDFLNGKVPFELNVFTSTFTNKEAFVVELKIRFSDEDKKWLPIKFDQPVWGTFERFYFDPNTGLPLRYEHNYVLDDQSLVPSAITENFQIMPNMQPPADVINLIVGE